MRSTTGLPRDVVALTVAEFPPDTLRKQLLRGLSLREEHSALVGWIRGAHSGV
jgi:hypothetical protein